MLKKGRVAAKVFGVVLCAALGTMSVSAAEITANEPEVTLTTSQSEYSGSEQITETVKIQNTTKEALTDITIKGNIPEEYVTEAGVSKQWEYSISEVAEGDFSEVAVTFLKKGAVETTDGNTNNGDAASGNTTERGKALHTGDSSHVGLWILICVISLCAVILLVKKKKGKKGMSVFLAAVMAGSFLWGGAFSANAAEADATADNIIEKTVEASKDIVVDGEKITLTVQVTYHVADETDTEEVDDVLSYEGYTKKWGDEFDGTELNRNDWNVELHEPGWVNAELQKYVDSEDNIYLEDGKLVIKPIQTKNADGTYSYTSGRVNTQGKHDFKYGLFEARVKVPEGKGYLPAFWLMPTTENIYGQWPRCGEIDIMEVHGSKTDTAYGTIHYGNPHKENQSTYVLEDSSFADEYHTFAVEWEPGKIKWYVDGRLYHETDDWYSATEGQGEITYPAPFDQPFYMILNLAVGGSWVGYPDETTDFENQAYEVDYVRVYQKDSYDENVNRPEKEVVLREPDANGNYVVNGDFAVAESLTDDKDWTFLTANGGEATAEIKNNAIHINTTKEGDVDYSVQLVQPNLPMQKGAYYRVSFDAYADAARTMGVKISAPDNGWIAYWNESTVNLSTEKKTYTYDFRMTNADDANGRLEFNMGNTGSTAAIHISNVKLEKTGYEEIAEDNTKTVLADGNYVYNGGFQEGNNRLGYWDIDNKAGADISVTNADPSDRRLRIIAPKGTSEENSVIISQSDLAMTAGDYAFSFEAEGDAGKTITFTVAGETDAAQLTGGRQTVSKKFAMGETADKSVLFKITEPGTYYLDNVRIVEDSLIKNGSFSGGFAGYEPFVDGSASASYVVDSLNEDNAADFTINNTGDAAWKIQLKQNNIELEQGQWYRLSLDAKSSIARKIMFAIQRDGSVDDDWTPYSGEKIIELGNDYQTYDITFQMKNATDLKALLSISMGAVDGTQIAEQHRVCIDNIKLEKIEAPEIPEIPAGENLLQNPDFLNDSMEPWSETIANWEADDAGAAATRTISQGAIVYDVTDPGANEWNVQLKQSGLALEAGATYEVTFKVNSTAARTIKTGVMSTSYTWYGGADIPLEANVEQTVTYEFVMTEADLGADFYISMGKIEGEDTPASTITISEIKLIKK